MLASRAASCVSISGGGCQIAQRLVRQCRQHLLQRRFGAVLRGRRGWSLRVRRPCRFRPPLDGGHLVRPLGHDDHRLVAGREPKDRSRGEHDQTDQDRDQSGGLAASQLRQQQGVTPGRRHRVLQGGRPRRTATLRMQPARLLPAAVVAPAVVVAGPALRSRRWPAPGRRRYRCRTRSRCRKRSRAAAGERRRSAVAARRRGRPSPQAGSPERGSHSPGRAARRRRCAAPDRPDRATAGGSGSASRTLPPTNSTVSGSRPPCGCPGRADDRAHGRSVPRCAPPRARPRARPAPAARRAMVARWTGGRAPMKLRAGLAGRACKNRQLLVERLEGQSNSRLLKR